MPMVRDGGRRANPSDVEHLARMLRSGFFIHLYDGIVNAIITTVSINGHTLSVMLCTQLRVNLCKELLASLEAARMGRGE
jgi:hypothetical protein